MQQCIYHFRMIPKNFILIRNFLSEVYNLCFVIINQPLITWGINLETLFVIKLLDSLIPIPAGC